MFFSRLVICIFFVVVCSFSMILRTALSFFVDICSSVSHWFKIFFVTNLIFSFLKFYLEVWKKIYRDIFISQSYTPQIFVTTRIGAGQSWETVAPVSSLWIDRVKYLSHHPVPSRKQDRKPSSQNTFIVN